MPQNNQSRLIVVAPSEGFQTPPVCFSNVANFSWNDVCLLPVKHPVLHHSCHGVSFFVAMTIRSESRPGWEISEIKSDSSGIIRVKWHYESFNTLKLPHVCVFDWTLLMVSVCVCVCSVCVWVRVCVCVWGWMWGVFAKCRSWVSLW